MKVGSLVYATNQGLGILAKDFYKHKVVTDVMLIEHPHHENHYNWYPFDTPTTSLRKFDTDKVLEFCKTVDVMLFFETPFNWSIIKECRSLGIKTVLMTMYECTPTQVPYSPDLYLCPSVLDLQYFPTGKFIPVPVPDEIRERYRERQEAKVFVHNAGNGGLKGRNGTAEILEAWRFVKSEAKLVIRTQNILNLGRTPHFIKYDLITGTQPYETLYDTGDVFLFPEKFNGLALPLQEAYGSGMLVMSGNRFPMNTWLPVDPLIKVNSYRKNRIGPAYKEFKEAIITPRDIAENIDKWYNKDVSKYSVMGKKWADNNSWDNLKPVYLEIFNKV